MFIHHDEDETVLMASARRTQHCRKYKINYLLTIKNPLIFRTTPPENDSTTYDDDTGTFVKKFNSATQRSAVSESLTANAPERTWTL